MPFSRQLAQLSLVDTVLSTLRACLDTACQALLTKYETSGDPEVADHLIESLNAADASVGKKPLAMHPVSPNQLASHFVRMAKAPADK